MTRTESPTTKCRECDAEISFVRTRRDKQMPVNAESLTEEDVEVLSRVGGVVDYRHDDHESHFATCSDPDRFRKPR